MGELIEFPRPLVVRAGGFTILPEEDYDIIDDGVSVLEIKPAAKSSTSVMQAAVCQGCGCKRDGKLESIKAGCTCLCHKGEH